MSNKPPVGNAQSHSQSTIASTSHTQACVIAPSILSANFARLGDEVNQLEKSGADWIHFDVMDNHYVPNLTIGPLVCEAIRPLIKLPIDVHLMVEDPDRLASDFAKAGADSITVHPESTRHLDRSLQLIADAGCRAGVVLNPSTPVQILDHIMDRVDLILLMSVNPGFGGQSFIPSVLPKLRQVRERIDQHQAAGGRAIRLQVDGGVNAKTIESVALAGADTFVAGSAVFGAGSPDEGYGTIVGRLRELAVAAVR
ncbi:MAG: ribulose-phosphate 3-epimerase [Burkholderiaceae bacterium]